MEKEKKKKDEENSLVKVNQPIWRNNLQRISEDLPPEQQFRLPIFKLSRLKVSPSHLTPYMNLSQLTNWHLVQNAKWALPHYRGNDTPQNFQSELDSGQGESNGYCPESIFLWSSLAFQSKHFILKTESQAHTFLSDYENNLYEWKCSVPKHSW